MSHKQGIDYGLGQTNIDKSTGIRYGVIPQNEICQAWADSSEADYGPAHCPECGAEAGTLNDEEQIIFGDSNEVEPDADWNDGKDYACLNCEECFWSDACFPDEALAFTYDANGIKAEQSGGDSDIFILKSPFYTLCQFCSPCAPGAGYVMNTVESNFLTPEAEQGIKAYCFGHDWFEDGKAPYPVFSVTTNDLVQPDAK